MVSECPCTWGALQTLVAHLKCEKGAPVLFLDSLAAVVMSKQDKTSSDFEELLQTNKNNKYTPFFFLQTHM